MRLFILLLIIFFQSPSTFARSELRDLSIDQVWQSTCGTMAMSAVQKVYMVESKSPGTFKTPIFDKKVDDVVRANIKDLTSQTPTFSDNTPDSVRLKFALLTFAEIKKNNLDFSKLCEKATRKQIEKCFKFYQASDKLNGDACERIERDTKAFDDLAKSLASMALPKK